MKNKILLLAAAALVLTLAFDRALVKPVLAEARAILVQSVDEPARNPYQETELNVCNGTEHCNIGFAPVPIGKRLVITHISGYVDTSLGVPPDSYLQSSSMGNLYATAHFSGTRGTQYLTGTARIDYNQDTLAYFGPGEVPIVYLSLYFTTDHFTGDGQISLAGYYINL